MSEYRLVVNANQLEVVRVHEHFIFGSIITVRTLGGKMYLYPGDHSFESYVANLDRREILEVTEFT